MSFIRAHLHRNAAAEFAAYVFVLLVAAALAAGIAHNVRGACVHQHATAAQASP